MNALTLAKKYRLQSEKREILFNLAALYKSTDEKEYYQFLNMMYETEVSLHRGGEFNVSFHLWRSAIRIIKVPFIFI